MFFSPDNVIEFDNMDLSSNFCSKTVLEERDVRTLRFPEFIFRMTTKNGTGNIF